MYDAKYGNIPRKKPPINKPKASPFGNRTGFFKFKKTTDENGHERNVLVEHIDPELGLIFKKNEENGDVIIDLYEEAEALLAAEKAPRCP